jgi:hypothetical protein
MCTEQDVHKGAGGYFRVIKQQRNRRTSIITYSLVLSDDKSPNLHHHI